MTAVAVPPATSDRPRHVLAVRPALRADLCALRYAMRGLRAALKSPPRQDAMQPHHLVTLGEAYGKHNSYTLSTVSTYAAQSGSFLGRIAAGKWCHIKTYNRALQWFSDNWPADLAWPSDVPRPAPAERTKP